jgi:Ca2+-binding RTX toxin-like protein
MAPIGEKLSSGVLPDTSHFDNMDGLNGDGLIEGLGGEARIFGAPWNDNLVSMHGPVAAAALPVPTLAGITPIQMTGPNSNRVGIAFLGDGYTSGEIAGQYITDVNRMTNYLFTGGPLSEPFNRYRNFFNVYAINVVSNESGADNRATGTLVDTALNARYYGDGITDRLLTIDYSLGSLAIDQAVAGSGIRSDIRLVTVNSSTYGGSGGYFAVYAGGNPNSHEVALHEVGHSFANLADEYTYAGTGGSGGLIYTGGEFFAENVTTDPTAEKWSRWLGYDQPGVGLIGAYQGAAYYQQGLYRPSANSKMASLNQPFDAVAREAFVLAFYRIVDPLDWFTPEGELTDPVSLVATAIDPAIVTTRWSVDGAVVDDGTLSVFDVGNWNINSGTHVITAFARDLTDWVRKDHDLLGQEVSWTVTLTEAVLHSDGSAPVEGGPLRDLIFGGPGQDALIGNAGNDVLDGGTGADSMKGGADDDTYYVDDVGDLVIENGQEGTDTVIAVINYRMAADVESLVLAAEAGAISGIGNDLANELTGNESGNSLLGGLGDDTLFGGLGADTLRGGDGDDWIEGEGGSDNLYGERGADRFVYQTHTASLPGFANRDVIRDFEPGQDKIDFSGFADQNFTFVAAFTGVAGQIAFEAYNARYTMVRLDLNGDERADMQIQVQIASGFLNNEDFLL